MTSTTGKASASTISFWERPFPVSGTAEPLPRWVVASLIVHLALIAVFFLAPFLPSRERPAPPVYVVDLVGGEKIGGLKLGTEISTPAPTKPKIEASKPAVPEPKKPAEEVKTQEVKAEKTEKPKPAEKKPAEEKVLALKEKAKTEPPAVKKEASKEPKEETKSETASADSVRERLLQSALDRAKSRGESSAKPAKGELSSGAGEGEGATALGQGGRGGPGILKGMDFIIYQNRMLSTIKENWAWVGQRSNLKVVVHFGIKDSGEIVGLKIVQPSGDPSYDESVLRAVKKSSPLSPPPETYRRDFADVELTFRPRDLGA
ncbi:MAG TPA: cell envelope integrity protein TolA [Candidatus Binatia bacterium]